MTGVSGTSFSEGPFGSHRLRGMIATFIVAQVWCCLLLVFEWGHGVARGMILAGLLAGLILLRFRPRPAAEAVSAGTKLTGWIRVCLILALMLDFGVAGYATLRSVRTGEIPMDQGQTTWRAARLLWRGENPFRTAALVDYTAYTGRPSFRDAAGMASTLPTDAAVDAGLQRYDETLDPALRRQLLPVPAGQLTGTIAREARVYGYKYGPIPLLVTTPFVWLGLPAVVVILNFVACFGLFVVYWRLLGSAGVGAVFAALGLLVLMLDPFMGWNFLAHTATDVWALLFCGLAVMAFVEDRPMLTAAALALAFGSKIFPSVLLFPLVLRFRSVRPVALLAGLSAFIYLPWLVWDPPGLVYNIFLFPVLRVKDTTSWQHYASPLAANIVRVVALAGIATLWVRFLSRRENRLFWTLAMVNMLLLLSAGSFHDNYLTWASIWIFAAVVEAFAIVKARQEHELPADDSSLAHELPLVTI
jgi:Glycosyltransferase family 87